MNPRRIAWVLALGMLLARPVAARAVETGSVVSAAALLESVASNRPARDFSLKGRLLVTRDRAVPIELLVKISPAETRTIYRAGSMELLVLQPVRGEPRFFLKGRGELTGAQRLERLLDSSISYYDLGLPFLQWPNPKLLGAERLRGRDCYLLEVAAESGPYRRAKIWIDQEYHALLRAEAFNEYGDTVKRFLVASVKRMDDVWLPGSLEIAFVPAGQSLPSQEKSRLEFYDGHQNLDLSADWFRPENFGTGSGKAGAP